MIKSDIGGPLMMAGLFSILYALKGERWYLPTLLMGSGYLVIRIASFLIDGFSEVAFMGIIVEIIFVVMVAAYRAISKIMQ